MFKQALIVFFKEMKDLLRDKKTFLFGLIIPFLLIPTMLFIIDFSMSSKGNAEDDVYVAFSNTQNSFYEFCTIHKNIKIVNVEDPKAALDTGKISAYIEPSDTLDEDIINKKDPDINIEFSSSSLGSMLSSTVITYYKEIYSAMVSYLTSQEEYQITNIEDLKKFLLDESLNKVFLEEYPLKSSKDLNIDTSSLYFNMLVPMMLILYCCVGSSSTASDISAGEKERGTLEPLLSTGANRNSIIIGKLFATTTMGLISGLCTVLGLSFYLVVSSGSKAYAISFFDVVALLLITLFTAMFFAAVNLTLGVYSKSTKEAQTYLMPVSIISLIPTYFTYSMDLNSVNITHLSIPIVNVVCIIKEILAGAVNFLHLGIVLAWLLVYVLIAFSLTAHIFKKESVVFRI